jgi:PAS domain-containing protein
MQRNALLPSGRLRQTDGTDAPGLTQEGQLWVERLAAIVSLSADAIVALDLERRIVLYNEGAETIFGWRPTSAVRSS